MTPLPRHSSHQATKSPQVTSHRGCRSPGPGCGGERGRQHLPDNQRRTLKEEGDQTRSTHNRLITNWIQSLRGQPKDARNSPVTTQIQPQRPHPKATLRSVVAGTRRRRRKMRRLRRKYETNERQTAVATSKGDVGTSAESG
jgi:hypothetical protein